MNEFLLLAVVIVYLAICHGRSTTKTSRDRQGHWNEQSSHPDVKQSSGREHGERPGATMSR